MSCKCSENRIGGYVSEPTPCLEKEKDIPVAFNELSCSIEMLSDAVNDLCIRLYPILRDSEPNTELGDVKAAPNSTPMVREMWNQIERINFQKYILKDVLSRLEI